MDKLKGFSKKRIEEVARTADVVARAKAVNNPALKQGTDRLGTPGMRRRERVAGRVEDLDDDTLEALRAVEPAPECEEAEARLGRA